MASYFDVFGPAQYNIPTPITLTAIQRYVGPYIRIIELINGDLMVVSEHASESDPFTPLNTTASGLAGKSGPIFGHAVLCSPQEIA